MSELQGAQQEEADPPPPYIIFMVVFLFFITGLCGFLVCHLLKLKGYRCTMEEDDDEEELDEDKDDDEEENQDTVEKILKCIIENEANMEAFNEMVGKGNVCVRHDPRLRKESIGGLPPHMHTVHSGTDLHDTCHLCTQIRNKRARRASRTPRFRREQTVFSVGRFRVTHTDKKSADGGGQIPDVLVNSGDNLDQSQDSEERRDGGYNLRSLFRDSRPPSEGNHPGKRRRSLTIFGLRRGSDPIGVKVVGAGREGVRFIPQPVVLEEPHHENGQNGEKRVSKAGGGSSDKTASRIKTASDESVVKRQAQKSVVSESSATQKIKILTKESSMQGIPLQTQDTSILEGPRQAINLQTQETPILEGSRQANYLQTQETPILEVSRQPINLQTQEAPISESPTPGFLRQTNDTPALLTSPPTSLPMSLSSSPKPSSRETSEPVHLSPGPLQTSTPLMPLPNAAQEFVRFIPQGLPGSDTPPDPCTSPVLERDSFASPALISLGSSPRLTSRTPTSPANANSEFSQGQPTRSNKSVNSLQTSSPSFSLQDDASEKPSLKSSTSQTKLEGSAAPISIEKSGMNLGELEGDKSASQLSTPSPLGARVGSVTIIKASPDSKREFSVSTMVEDNAGAGKGDEGPAGGGGARVTWTLGDEKEDMVEMEEIAECRVTQADGIGTEGKGNDEAPLE